MGDYGINQTFEYVEMLLDSSDAITSIAQSFEGSDSPTDQIKYSWPLYYFTSRKLNVAAFKVLQAEIPFVYDVINTANNTFIYTLNGTPYTITIPSGTYTAPQLAAILQTLLDDINPGFTVTFSTVTLRFTFTNPTADTWSLTFASRATPYSILGFLPATITSASGLSSEIVSPTVAQVSGPFYLYVNSSKVGSLVNCNLTDGSRTAGVGPEVARIPVNVQYGSVIFYNDPCPEKFFDFFAGIQFNTFDFYLTAGSNQYQKPLDMKGTAWSLKIGLLCYREATADVYHKPVRGSVVQING